MALTQEALENYISERGYAENQIRSFDHFLTVKCHESIAGRRINCSDGSIVEFLRFKIDDLSEQDRADITMTPQLARLRAMTYATTWYIEARIIALDGVATHKTVKVGSVPLMVGCCKCFTKNLSPEEKLYYGEDPDDRGGQVYIKGNEMYMTGVDRTSTDVMISVPDKVKIEGDHKIATAANTRITLTTDKGTDLNMVSFTDSILRFSLPSIATDDKAVKYSVNVVRLYMMMGLEISEMIDSIVEFTGDQYRDDVITALTPSVQDVILSPDHVAEMSKMFVYSKLKLEERNNRRLKSYDIKDEDLIKIVENTESIDRSRNHIHTAGLMREIIEKFGTQEDLIFALSTIRKSETSGTKSKKKLAKLSETKEKLANLRAIYEIEQTLQADLFPFIKSRFALDFSENEELLEEDVKKIRKKKLKMLSMLCARHIMLQIGVYPPDNRDAWINKRLIFTGEHFLQKVRGAVGIAFGQAAKNGLSNESPISVINTIADSMKLEANINRLFFPQKGGEESNDSGSSRYTNGNNVASAASSMNTIVSPVSSRSESKSKRELSQDAIGFLCPVKIVENETAGLTKQLALTSRVARAVKPEVPIRAVLNHDSVKEDRDWKMDEKTAMVTVSGAFTGWTNSKYELRDYLVDLKRKGGLDKEVSIALDDNVLLVSTTGGYLVRPLLLVDLETQQLVCDLADSGVRKTGKVDIDSWVDKGWISYVSVREQELSVIAMSTEELKTKRKNIKDRVTITMDDILEGNLDDTTLYYLPDVSPISNAQLLKEMRRRLETGEPQIELSYSYCELWKCDMVGYNANLSPYSETNQAPRNAYQGNMTEQATGRGFSNVKNRYHDTVKLGPFSRGTLVNTAAYRGFRLDKQGTATTAMTAITASEGTEEDGIKKNLDSTNRGEFATQVLSPFKIKINTSDGVIVDELPYELRRRDKNYDNVYSKNDPAGPAGYPKIKKYVKEGDCILSAYKEVNGHKIDQSYYLRVGDKGIIMSYNRIVDEKGKGIRDKTIVSILLSNFDFARKGNKQSNENSQKNTICDIRPGINFPYTDEGVRPNICTSVHSFSTRMTVSSFKIMMMTTLASIMGRDYDATIFEKSYTFKEAEEQMKGTILMVNLIDGTEHRFDGSCYYRMRSGLTGEYLKNKVFMAPIPWQVLKHLVELKQQVRGAIGAKDSKTRQPVKGKKMGGGLKVGVQTKNALISSGAIRYVVNKFIRTSNSTTVIVCGYCGMEANPYGNPSSDSYKAHYYCGICDPTNSMSEEEKVFYKVTPTASFTNIQKFMSMMSIRIYMKVLPRESELVNIEEL